MMFSIEVAQNTNTTTRFNIQISPLCNFQTMLHEVKCIIIRPNFGISKKKRYRNKSSNYCMKRLYFTGKKNSIYQALKCITYKYWTLKPQITFYKYSLLCV